MKLSKNNKKILICLGGGISQIPLIKAAKKKNYQLIVIDKNKECPGEKLAEIFLNISASNEDKIIKKLNELKVDKKMIEGVINRSSGKAILTMSKIQKKLRLNGSDPKMVGKTLNKNDFIIYCIKNNILVPRTFNKKIKKKTFSKIKFPVIVKPCISKVGKKGISIIHKIENLQKGINFAKKYSEDKSLIIQEKIDGKDIVILGAVKNKKFLELTTIDEFSFINKNIIKRFCYRNPSQNLNLTIKKKITNMTNKIIKIFKLNNCPLNLSFRVKEKNKVYLIEINLEISGELIHEKLIKSKNKKFNSFEWYLDVLFSNNKNLKPINFLSKTIRINDKILRVNNAKYFR